MKKEEREREREKKRNGSDKNWYSTGGRRVDRWSRRLPSGLPSRHRRGETSSEVVEEKQEEHTKKGSG